MGLSAGNGQRGIVAEMNVIPLIDILLVLLVIFMLIPVRRGLDAQLPQRDDAGQQPEAVVVEVLGDGSLCINREPVRGERLRQRLDDIFKTRAERVAFVRGDSGLDFEAVARVIDVMRASRITVGLLPPDAQPVR